MILIVLVLAVCFGLITGDLACRKNRNAWGWGVFGGLAFLPTMLVLMFMSFLCPKCKGNLTNKQWKGRTCPRCGQLAKSGRMVAAGIPTKACRDLALKALDEKAKKYERLRVEQEKAEQERTGE